MIVRELLLGSNRFSVLQRGLPRISPTVLNKRLKELEASGVIVKRRLTGQRGHEYRLTPAGKELSSVVDSIAVRGMRWARDEMEPVDLDVTFLMFDVQRNIVLDELPDGESVLCFQFPDLTEFRQWWVVCGRNETHLCYQDPGNDVNAYITAISSDLIGVWIGDVALDAALKDERVKLHGEAAVRKRFKNWFPLSSAAAVPRPSKLERMAD